MDIELYEHQAKGVEYIAEGGRQLWMDMRTGKTFTAIFGVKALKDRKIYYPFPCLIVCPSSIKITWKRGLQQCGVPDRWITVADGKWTKKKKETFFGSPEHMTKFVIVNYEMLYNYDVLSLPWKFVIYDESVRLGNMKPNTTKYALKKFNPEIRYLALSGAPASENHLQLFPQYMATQGHYMGYEGKGAWTDYLEENHRYIKRTWSWKAKKKHLEEVMAYVKETSYCVSREELGLGSPKLYDIRYTPINKKQEDLLEFIKKANTYVDKDGKTKEMNPLNKAYFEQYTCTGCDPFTGKIINKAKIDDALAYAKDIGEPMVFMSRYSWMIDALYEAMIKAKLKVAKIDGTVSEKDRDVIRQAFMDGKYDYVIGQTETIKMGLDFSRATTIFYLSNSFSQDDRAQSEERATRVDKTEPVQIIDSCSEGTVDDLVVKLLMNKMEISSSYLEGYYG